MPFPQGIRTALLIAGLYAAGANPSQAVHLQIAGEWCFIETPSGQAPVRAVILIHGNGETVGPETSTWERSPGSRFFMDRLLQDGFLIAQSNAAAVPATGMWGNKATQKSVAALMDRIQTERGVKTFEAVALSAGNLTLLNLVLAGEKRFGHAVLAAPVISLDSLYRCPGGFDRVTQIAASFGFSPAHGCPGDPRGDAQYLQATKGYDPMASLAAGSGATAALRGVQWMTCYEENDPKVPPAENILKLRTLLQSGGIPMKSWMLPGAATHGSAEMMRGCAAEASPFLAQK